MRFPVPDDDLVARDRPLTSTPSLRRSAPAAPSSPTASSPASGPDTRYVPRHGQAAIPVRDLTPPVQAPRGPVIPATGPLARALHHLLRSAALAVEARRESDPSVGGGIRIATATAAAPLVVHDDGVGLTGDEVRGLLTASVSGSDLVPGSRAGEVPTPFAAVLRACLAVADVVELRSRTATHPGAPTLKAVVRADGTVRVSIAGSPLAGPGTEVRLHLRPQYRPAAGEHLLPALVHALTDQMSVPVDLDGTRVPRRGPVWDLAPAERLDWCRERLGLDALAVLPLGEGPHGVRAVAVVLPDGLPDDARLAHRVHVGGLRVDDAPADLLPGWAGFCRVVLDAGRLPLAGDGDTLVPGPELDAVRAHLARAVLAQLILLEAYEPERFQRLTAVHEDALVDAALGHADVMDLVRSTLPVPTTLGPLSLDAVRGVVGVLACAGPDTWPAVREVAARDGLLVVDARRPGVVRLLETLGADGPPVAMLRPSDLRAFGVAVAS